MEKGYEYVGQSKGNPVLHHRTTAGTLEPVTRMSQTEEQLQELDRASGRLSDCLTRLEEKLAGVTRGDYPADCCEAAKEDVLVPVADTIRSMRKRVGWSCDRIDSILNRLEV